MLDALFRPRSVAIVGASNNPLSIGHIVLQNLLDHNFKGPIFPVNPKSAFIKSFKAYPSVSAIPDEVDLVNISIKNTLVPAIIEDCGQKGVKFAIVHTAGFKEVGEEGLALEKQIVEIAHKYGMRQLHLCAHVRRQHIHRCPERGSGRDTQAPPLQSRKRYPYVLQFRERSRCEHE